MLQFTIGFTDDELKEQYMLTEKNVIKALWVMIGLIVGGFIVYYFYNITYILPIIALLSIAAGSLYCALMAVTIITSIRR